MYLWDMVSRAIFMLERMQRDSGLNCSMCRRYLPCFPVTVQEKKHIPLMGTIPHAT